VPSRGAGGSGRLATVGCGGGGRQSGDTREGEGGEFGQVGPPGRERDGARGPAQEKDKRARPKGIVKILIYSNNFQMSSNCFTQKVDLPSSKKFK
jgi:hypothetical protein